MRANHERLNIHKVDPKAHEGLLQLEKYVRDSQLDPRLYELVKIRASQLNGCAFCLDMHTRDALAAGETQRRINILSAWKEAPTFFTGRERAALGLTEAVTKIADSGVTEDVWEAATQEFGEEELVALLMAINAINVWNRLAVATHQHLPE